MAQVKEDSPTHGFGALYSLFLDLLNLVDFKEPKSFQ